MQAALGLPMKLVEGYGGTAKVRLAAESGEIDGGCWAWESIKPTWAKGLQSGEVHIVLQSTEKSHPDLKKVPLAMNLAFLPALGFGPFGSATGLGIQPALFTFAMLQTYSLVMGQVYELLNR